MKIVSHPTSGRRLGPAAAATGQLAAGTLVWLFLFLGFRHAVAAEQMLEIEGAFSSMQQPARPETNWTDFTLKVAGARYQVSNHYFNAECLMSGSDGTNGFFLNKMATAGQNRWESGEITAGRFPARDLSPGQLCWLAFASQGCLTSTPATLPLEAFQENGEHFRCTFVLATNRPYLPVRIQWYGSNYWYFSKVDARRRAELPYTNGFLAAEYIVTSTTNFESLELPTGFSLSTFLPSFKRQGKRMLDPKAVTLTSLLRGRVNRIRFVEPIRDFRPPLGPQAQITDLRIPLFPDGYLSLTRTNGKWPEPGDEDLARLLNTVILRGPQPK